MKTIFVQYPNKTLLEVGQRINKMKIKIKIKNI